jgi:hypothetical protein
VQFENVMIHPNHEFPQRLYKVLYVERGLWDIRKTPFLYSFCDTSGEYVESERAFTVRAEVPSCAMDRLAPLVAGLHVCSEPVRTREMKSGDVQWLYTHKRPNLD